MSSYFQDKNGSYHSAGTYLLVTFAGGIISALIVGYLTESLNGAVIGFFGYYVLKILIKFFIKMDREEKATETYNAKQKSAQDDMKAFNREIEDALFQSRNKLTRVTGIDSVTVGPSESKTVGTFVIPEGVKKFLALDYSFVKWSAYAEEFIYSVLINGKEVSSKRYMAAFRYEIYDCKEGDIVNLRITSPQGASVNGTFGIILVSDYTEEEYQKELKKREEKKNSSQSV